MNHGTITRNLPLLFLILYAIRVYGFGTAAHVQSGEDRGDGKDAPKPRVPSRLIKLVEEALDRSGHGLNWTPDLGDQRCSWSVGRSVMIDGVDDEEIETEDYGRLIPVPIPGQFMDILRIAEQSGRKAVLKGRPLWGTMLSTPLCPRGREPLTSPAAQNAAVASGYAPPEPAVPMAVRRTATRIGRKLSI
jgi:hypothetical protein